MACEFNPHEEGQIITCGKSHISFWTLADGKLTKKQGLFEVNKNYNILLNVPLAPRCGVIFTIPLIWFRNMKSRSSFSAFRSLRTGVLSREILTETSRFGPKAKQRQLKSFLMWVCLLWQVLLMLLQFAMNRFKQKL